MINSFITEPGNCTTVDAFDVSGEIFNYSAATLTVPYGTDEKYRAVAPWSNFTNIVERAPEGPLAYFSMADATMRMGEKLTLSVNLNNSVDITSFQCDIRLPEGFEAVKNAQGKPVVKLGARKSRTHTISSNVMADGAVRVACFSTSLATFAGNEGELFTVEILPVTAAVGVHEVTIDGIIAAKPDAKGVNIEPTKCSITLKKALMPGDVNDDDVVNVSDAIALVGRILGDTPENFLSENADINGDALVNILDVTEVMRIVLGTDQASKAPALAKAQKLNVANVSETEALYVENFEIKSGEEKLLPIKLRADRDYTGFQTDIYLPEGLEVMTYTEGGVTAPDVELNEESNSGTHILDSAMQKDGALRVISLSLANEMYGHSSDNTLFTVRVRVKPGFTASVTSPIYFRNTLFNTGKAESHFADSSSEIGINNHTTGIEDVIEHNNSKQYFNLQGMPVKNPTKGMIYILKTATSAEKVVF